jgi:hypothetical protein
VARGLLRTGFVAVALFAGAGWTAAQDHARFAPNRQVEDRRVDESGRRAEPRQTETPKPPAPPTQSNTTSRGESRVAVQRQPEPQRQLEPQRQHEPRRQHEPQRQAQSSSRDKSDHWNDPGPAWSSQGPAWRDLNDRPGVQRPGVQRPGEDAFRAKPGTYAPRDRDGRRDRDSRRGGVGRKESTVYYVPYPYPIPVDAAPYYPSQLPLSQLEQEPAPAPAPAISDDDRPLGFLHLRVQPRTADVFVDGILAGTVDDFGGRGARMLTAGTHRVEIRAPGYETLTFDVRVPENDTVTFTRELDPAVDRPAPEPVVVPRKTLYVVPMCFIGDRPPLVSDMPAGCRVEDVRVIP